MLDPSDRCLLHHYKGLLSAEVIGDVYQYFQAVETRYQSDRRSLADENRVRIGAATDTFRFDPKWFEPWRHVTANAIDRLAPFTWIVFPPQIRHVTEAAHLVPWHQDIGYVRRMERGHAQIITCFVPIEPDPMQASTLEFALGQFDELQHGPIGGHGAALAEMQFSKTTHFDLKLGDALVFGDHVPHRTIRAADGQINRRSFEFRLIMPEHALPDKDYFDIRIKSFVRRGGTRRRSL